MPPARRRGWLRKLCWVFGGLMVLLVIAGFVVTSGAFFKGVVLPRVGAAMNAEVTVSEASIRPFSRVVLQGLEVKPSGAETLLTAGEIRLSYRLMSILRGDLVIDEVTIERPVAGRDSGTVADAPESGNESGGNDRERSVRLGETRG